MPNRVKAWPLGENMVSVEHFHEATFSGVAGTLRPFVAMKEATREPGGYSQPTGPPAYGEGGWSPREVKKEKTRVTSAKWNIPPDRCSCGGRCVHVKCYGSV